ncbi:hypothetical protein MP11Mi_30120 [Gordonia sp. MP11Mi]|uniref:Uncharacterized protein n=1 Tax=Gordonia sp. MP11Mi TaxID=3022769 RepID=A0AA97GWJ1_9ACTN
MGDYVTRGTLVFILYTAGPERSEAKRPNAVR